MALRVVFMGTPDFSVPTLERIIASGHDVVGVYSQPPRPAGRGMAEKKSPVHGFAEQRGLLVKTPKSLRNTDEAQLFAELNADVAVVIAYGLILPPPILGAPRAGCLNVHASLLPRWRGAAPIQRAIMAGDNETAVMIMQMEAGLDTGPVCRTRRVAIEPDQTAGELHDALALAGGELMQEVLVDLEQGSLDFVPQSDEGVTYAKKIEKGEAHIDFGADAQSVHNQIRGLSPFPGAWFEIANNDRRERIKVLRSKLVARPDEHADAAPGEVLDSQLLVACGEGAVQLIALQRAGKKVMAVDELLRGFAIAPGTLLQ